MPQSSSSTDEDRNDATTGLVSPTTALLGNEHNGENEEDGDPSTAFNRGSMTESLMNPGFLMDATAETFSEQQAAILSAVSVAFSSSSTTPTVTRSRSPHEAPTTAHDSSSPSPPSSSSSEIRREDHLSGTEASPAVNQRGNGRLNNGTVRFRVPPGAHIHVVGPNGSTRFSSRPPLTSETLFMNGVPETTLMGTRNPQNRSRNGGGGGRGNHNGTPSNLSTPSTNRSPPRGAAPNRFTERWLNTIRQNFVGPPGTGTAASAASIGRHPLNNSMTANEIPSGALPHSAMPQVETPKLKPLVLPDTKQDRVDVLRCAQIESMNLDDFRCTICCEYMCKPHGHHGCSTRLCEGCVKRLFGQGQGAVEEVRCPTCRKRCRFDEDTLLTSRILEAPKIRCQYASCNVTNLSLSEVADHEAVCPAVMVACRYKPLGCTWIGPRGDLSNHEDNDCALAKVSGLVHQHLNLQANFRHVSSLLQSRQSGSFQMQQVVQQQVQSLAVAMRQHQRLQRNAIRDVVASLAPIASPANPFHMAEYVVALFTTTLRTSPGRWKNMESTEAVANITNQLVLVPTIVLSTNLCCRQISLLSQTLISAPEPEVDLLSIAASCIGAFLGVLAVVSSFWLDKGSSVEWKTFHLKASSYFDLGKHDFKPFVSVCSMLLFGVLLLTVREDVGWGYACFYYAVATVSTVLFPMLFLVLALKSRGNPEAKIKWNTGRAIEPLLDGLWLGLWWVQGPIAGLDSEVLLLLAIFFVVLLQSKAFRYATVSLAAISAGALAAILRVFTNAAIDPTAFFVFLFATASSWLIQRGFAVGMSMMAQAAVSLRSELLLLIGVFSWAILFAL